jgi:Uma2 family endonuclease
MVNTAHRTTPTATVCPPEQRVLFHNLSWLAFEQILTALGEQRSARLTYDLGTLEITMPLEEHENASEWIALFIRILVEELNLKIKSMGSTTLKRPDLDKGAEPDKGYYIQNQPKVTGRNVDLTQDPPPDLVVEVDITHTDIDKLSVYAAMGVPEFWRYNGQELQIYQLQGKAYTELNTSPTFPNISKDRFYEFLSQCLIDEVKASKTLRRWIEQEYLA